MSPPRSGCASTCSTSSPHITARRAVLELPRLFARGSARQTTGMATLPTTPSLGKFSHHPPGDILEGHGEVQEAVQDRRSTWSVLMPRVGLELLLDLKRGTCLNPRLHDEMRGEGFPGFGPFPRIRPRMRSCRRTGLTIRRLGRDLAR